jgi:cytochrome c oxidase assembly factor CtaG
MSSVTQAVLLSWSIPPAASFALALTAIIYLRGWRLMRRAGVPFVPAWRAACFFGGLLTIWIALASPLDTFASFLITAHMSQHMLLMMIAPPLILLGAPLIPLVRGLPVFAAREFAGPFLNWRIAVRLGKALTNLWVALMLMGIVMFAWHTPRLYELALSSSGWHEFEHACFFLVSLTFWWPVVQPWPSQAQSPRWAVVPYLLIADLQNTILSAILVFSDRVLYPSYAQMPRLFGLSALHDQAASGAIMWVVGSAAFLVPAVVIAIRCLSGRAEQNAVRHLESLTPAGLGKRLSPGQGELAHRFGEHTAQAIAFLCLFAVSGFALAALASQTSDDDPVLIAQGTSGRIMLFVFALGELQSGSDDLAVLIQDSQSQEVLPQAGVEFHVEESGGSPKSGRVHARANESENKLLQSAAIDLPTGHSVLAISVQHGAYAAGFSLPVEVSTPETRFIVPWAFVCLFSTALLLAVVYISRHRRAGPARHISEEKLSFTNKAP